MLLVLRSCSKVTHYREITSTFLQSESLEQRRHSALSRMQGAIESIKTNPELEQGDGQ
jgi:hypothetical protein